MSDYIDRNRLKQGIQEDAMTALQGWDSSLMDLVMLDIDEIPAADVEPVRRGRWEPGNPICPVCGEDKFKGLDADIWSDWTPACCPNCGAKMDLEDEEP